MKKLTMRRTAKKTIKKIPSLFKSEKPHYKNLVCTGCKTEKVRVDDNVVSVICSKCAAKYGPTIKEKVEKIPTGFPRGWKLYSRFVHANGTVFEKGVEVPELFGKLDATKIEIKQKLTKREREKRKEEKEKKLVDKFYKKELMKKGKKQKTLNTKIKEKILDRKKEEIKLKKNARKVKTKTPHAKKKPIVKAQKRTYNKFFKD